MFHCKRLSNQNRNVKALSIIELLVSVSVIGIAIAGITELTWLNATWATKSFNKIDNYYAVQTFLERISRDIRMAQSVSTPSTFAVPNAVDEIDIVVAKTMKPPSNPSVSVFDVNGYPILYNPLNNLGPETVKYVVVPDPSNAGQYQIWYYSSQYENLGNFVVLNGVVGPTLGTTTIPKIFQYVAKNSGQLPFINLGDQSTGVQQSAPTDVGIVIVNLEVRRQTFGVSNQSETSSTSPSAFAVRTEVALRNATSY